MTYINPIKHRKRDYSAYSRFNYPEDYKEILHVTKFGEILLVKERIVYNQVWHIMNL